MFTWLRRLTVPRSSSEETAHREFVLRAVLISSIVLSGIYVIIDWAIVLPIRGAFAFGNFLWPPMMLFLIFNYWLVQRGHLKTACCLFLGAITISTSLTMYALGSKDIAVLLFAFGVSLAGILTGMRGAILVAAVDTSLFGVLAWAEHMGLRPPPVATTQFVDVIALALILAALTIVEWLFRFERGRLLQRYREQTVDLRTANEALEQANQNIVEQEALRRELTLAREIQASLLPRHDPTLADFDIKGRSLPAEEVGGDFYTYFPLSGGRLGLVVGDVSGKGMPSALYMAIATSIVEAQANASPDTVSLMQQVNNQLYPRMQETGMNIAMLYDIFDLTRRQLRVCNAGLIAPILFRDRAIQYLECYGLPLGAVTDGMYEEHLIDLLPGDVVLLMTDGIVEAMNSRRDIYGFSRLEAVLGSCDGLNAQTILDSVFDNVFKFMDGVSAQDDMTLVVIKVASNTIQRGTRS